MATGHEICNVGCSPGARWVLQPTAMAIATIMTTTSLRSNAATATAAAADDDDDRLAGTAGQQSDW